MYLHKYNVLRQQAIQKLHPDDRLRFLTYTKYEDALIDQAASAEELFAYMQTRCPFLQTARELKQSDAAIYESIQRIDATLQATIERHADDYRFIEYHIPTFEKPIHVAHPNKTFLLMTHFPSESRQSSRNQT